MTIREQAVLLLDVYATQKAWSPARYRFLSEVAEDLDVSWEAEDLAWAAWGSAMALDDEYDAALEGPQRLREGWTPDDV